MRHSWTIGLRTLTLSLFLRCYDPIETRLQNTHDRLAIDLTDEHGSFVPLIFSVTGGMGKRAQNFSKLLCDKISFKTRQRYSDVVNFYRCRLSFLIRKMVLLCIRGSRKTRCNKIESNIDENDFEYGCFESKLWFEGPMDSPFFMLRYLIRSLHIVSTTLYISYLYFKKKKKLGW